MQQFWPLTIGLAFLVPLGFTLVALGGMTEVRARDAALSVLAALGLGVVGYVVTGFALEYGGVGLRPEAALPGAEGLIWEWSAIGETWGAGWGMAGLSGWGMTGPAATSGAYRLALATLPWLTTAALLPLVTLRGRAPAWAAALLGLVMGALLYPVAGNWIWGGGWLAELGSNLGLGHGFVDPGGAGLVHVLGAGAAAAALVVFVPRRARSLPGDVPVPLPPVHLPLLAVTGAMLLLVGLPAWILANPLLEATSLDAARLTLNVVLAAAMGALLPLVYTWFVAGAADPLMAVRGMSAAALAAATAAAFIAPAAALGLGAVVGLLTLLAIYFFDHVLRLDDPAAVLSVHGLAGVCGVLAVGLLADGAAGQGWNGMSAAQGVTGLFPVGADVSGSPGQLQAQIVGVVALAAFSFFGAWLCVGPLALASQWLNARETPVPVEEEHIVLADPESDMATEPPPGVQASG